MSINLTKVQNLRTKAQDMLSLAVSASGSERETLLKETFDALKEAAEMYRERLDLEPSRGHLYANAIEIGSHIPELKDEVLALIAEATHENLPKEYANAINHISNMLTVETTEEVEA